MISRCSASSCSWPCSPPAGSACAARWPPTTCSTRRPRPTQVVAKISDPAAVSDSIADDRRRDRRRPRAHERRGVAGRRAGALARPAARRRLDDGRAATDDVAGNALTPLSEVASTLSARRHEAAGRPHRAVGLHRGAGCRGRGSAGITRRRHSVTHIERGRSSPRCVTSSPRCQDPRPGRSGDGCPGPGIRPAAGDARRRRPAQLPRAVPEQRRVALARRDRRRDGRHPHRRRRACSLAAQDLRSDFAKYPSPRCCRSTRRDRGDLRPAARASGCRTSRRCPDFTVSAAARPRDVGARARRPAGRRRDRDRPGRAVVPAGGDRPRALPSGDTLTAENAVPLLLNEVYLRYPDPPTRTAFFADAAASVFAALANGSADPAALLTALARAGDEHRLLLWSAHPEDQQILADTTLAGGLPVTDAETSPLRRLPQRRHRLEDGLLPHRRARRSRGTQCTIGCRGLRERRRPRSPSPSPTTPPPMPRTCPRTSPAAAAYGVPAGHRRTVGVSLPAGGLRARRRRRHRRARLRRRDARRAPRAELHASTSPPARPPPPPSPSGAAVPRRGAPAQHPHHRRDRRSCRYVRGREPRPPHRSTCCRGHRRNAECSAHLMPPSTARSHEEHRVRTALAARPSPRSVRGAPPRHRLQRSTRPPARARSRRPRHSPAPRHVPCVAETFSADEP